MNETILLRLTKTGKETLEMKKCIALLIICTLFLFGCAANAENGYPTAPKPTLPEHTPEPAAVKVEGEDTACIDDLNDIDTAPGNYYVCASYEDECGDLNGLMEFSTVVVRATPVSVEYENAAAIKWVLRIDESSLDLPETIIMRQMKDTYLLEEGKEVVLVLKYYDECGDYYIPSGNGGLFRTETDSETNITAMAGRFLDELLSRYPNAPAKAELTTRDVYNMLVSLG